MTIGGVYLGGRKRRSGGGEFQLNADMRGVEPLQGTNKESTGATDRKTMRKREESQGKGATGETLSNAQVVRKQYGEPDTERRSQISLFSARKRISKGGKNIKVGKRERRCHAEESFILNLKKKPHGKPNLESKRLLGGREEVKRETKESQIRDERGLRRKGVEKSQLEGKKQRIRRAVRWMSANDSGADSWCQGPERRHGQASTSYQNKKDK